MKVLFLDIDGPLNNHRAGTGLRAFNKLYDPVAVGLINRIAEHDVKIVLSSTKRKFKRDRAGCIRALKKAGAKFQIFSDTPVMGECRGHEIEAWINTRDQATTHYCIIDDDSDMLLEQMPHLVLVSNTDGITYKNYSDAKRILDIWS